MNSVIEYIMANYTWIIVGSIILLLAIIGGYADKTNFGQGKNKNSEETSNKEESSLNQQIIVPDNKDNEKKFEQQINATKQVNSTPIVSNEDVSIIQNSQTTQNIQSIQSIQPVQNIQSTQNIQPEQIILDNNDRIDIGNKIKDVTIEENNNYNGFKEFNNKFDEFDEEFNSILPKKDIIDDSLLDDIEDLSFDKTPKLDLSIPGLDDVELPKISGLENVEKKIWKK